MNFLQEIFTQLEASPDTTILQELRDGRIVLITGSELLEQVRKAQSFLAAQRLKKGDRCALLAHNGIRWVAMDLAIMAEGLIVVPLYARQAPEELVVMMKDCAPALICCGDAELRDGIVENWGEAPPQFVFDQIFDRSGRAAGRPRGRRGPPPPVRRGGLTAGDDAPDNIPYWTYDQGSDVALVNGVAFHSSEE